MIKPSMPGIGAMNDTLDFMKNLWGGMGMGGTGMPGMVMPTLSVEDINKKIADLKAVESWLTLNMNMLRSTIQALEVQAATISTLQSMGEQFSASMSAASQAAQGASSFAAAPSAAGTGAPPPSANPFSAPPSPPSAAQSSQAPQSAQTPHAAPAGRSDTQPTGRDQADAAQLTAPLVNAAAWWNMLQDQFKQAVSNAMTSEAAPDKSNGKAPGKFKADPAGAGEASAKSAAKSRTRAASSDDKASATPRKRRPAR